MAVRVDQTPISTATVNHWMGVIAGSRQPLVSSEEALRDQALRYLISSEWVVAEASGNGTTPSEQEVKNRVAQLQRGSSTAAGEQSFPFVTSGALTRADAMFQAKRELAVAYLKQRLAHWQPPISHAQIVSYYGHHRRRFTSYESRELEMTNRKSEAYALAIKRKIHEGKSFARLAQHETLELSPASYNPRLGSDSALARAIHLARPNVLIGPVKVRVDYYLLEVKRIIPGKVDTIAEAEGAIRKELAVDLQQQALARFIAAWRRKWAKKTDCHKGYIIQKCMQYRGPGAREDPFAFS